MLVPVPGAAVLEALPGCAVLDGLSRSQDLYHSLGRGSFSITAYSVPGVSHRSAHALTCQQQRCFVACDIDLCRHCAGAAPTLKGMRRSHQRSTACRNGLSAIDSRKQNTSTSWSKRQDHTDVTRLDALDKSLDSESLSDQARGQHHGNLSHSNACAVSYLA